MTVMPCLLQRQHVDDAVSCLVIRWKEPIQNDSHTPKKNVEKLEKHHVARV